MNCCNSVCALEMKLLFSSMFSCYFFISIWLLIPLFQGAVVPESDSNGIFPVACVEENQVEANPLACSTFYKCVKGVATLTACPPHLQFNEEWKLCSWQEQANCTRDVTVTNSGSSNSDSDGARENDDSAAPPGEPFTMIFDKYFPQLKEWEVKISNSTLLNIEPQPNAVIEADVLIFRNDTSIYKRKIKIHTAQKLENSTVVTGMLEQYTVKCAILNLKFRMVDNFPEPPPWCLPHLVNKVASNNNIRRAYNFLNRVSGYH